MIVCMVKVIQLGSVSCEQVTMFGSKIVPHPNVSMEAEASRVLDYEK